MRRARRAEPRQGEGAALSAPHPAAVARRAPARAAAPQSRGVALSARDFAPAGRRAWAGGANAARGCQAAGSYEARSGGDGRGGSCVGCCQRCGRCGVRRAAGRYVRSRGGSGEGPPGSTAGRSGRSPGGVTGCVCAGRCCKCCSSGGGCCHVDRAGDWRVRRRRHRCVGASSRSPRAREESAGAGKSSCSKCCGSCNECYCAGLARGCCVREGRCNGADEVRAPCS